jgi:hypothetical protein
MIGTDINTKMIASKSMEITIGMKMMQETMDM